MLRRVTQRPETLQNWQGGRCPKGVPIGWAASCAIRSQRAVQPTEAGAGGDPKDHWKPTRTNQRGKSQQKIESPTSPELDSGELPGYTSHSNGLPFRFPIGTLSRFY